MYDQVERAVEASDPDRGSIESLSLAQRRILERAVAKLVLLGERVGVSTDQMLLLLRTGLTVRELLEYLLDRTGEPS